MPRFTTLAVWLIIGGVAWIAYKQFNPIEKSANVHWKLQKLNSNVSNDSHEHRTSKVSGPLEVELQLVGDAPSKAGDIFEVIGVVKSEQDVNNATLEWVVIPNSEIVIGVQKQIVNVKAHVPYEVKATLKALNSRDQHVILRAKGSDGSLHFAQSAHYNNKVQLLDFKPPKAKTLPTAIESDSMSESKIRQ